MYLTSRIKEQFPAMLEMLISLPDDCLVTISDEKDSLAIHLQAGSLDEVRKLRRHFPGTFWSKRRSERLNWWEYDATVNGIVVNIYGCTEAPLTCRMIEREVEFEEEVPVAFEKRTVTKKVVEWECGEAASNALITPLPLPQLLP